MAMHKIKNLTNSPFDLQATTGKVRLPAFGEVEADFAPDYLQMLRKARTVDVIDHPLDHDGDGKKGGSTFPDGDADEASRLRAEYQDLFKKRPFNGWDAEELQRRIDEKLGE